MSIQTQYPNIRPSLLLDFANRRSLDPRITFSRAAAGRFYDGVTTVKAEENLLLRSQDYSATWTVTSLTPVTGKTAPDATSTATEFTASAADGVLTQGYTALAGDYTFSVWLRRVTGTGDIQIAADNGTWTTRAITSSWVRYDVTQTVTAGSKTAGVRVVTSGDAIEVWGAQLEQRSALTAYTPTTTQPITRYQPVLRTAADNVPRFDHNPATGESLGLLMEEQRTNLLQRSEEINNSVWGFRNYNNGTLASVTPNVGIAPDGTLTVDEINFIGAASLSRAYRFTCSTNQTYTFSAWMNATNINYCFNIAFGLSGVRQSFLNNVIIIGINQYLIRKSYTFTTPSTNCDSLEIVINKGGTSANGFAYIWGAQLELATTPSSYIPTVASQVTRAADSAALTGTNFSSWYNQGEGTVYIDCNIKAAAQRVISINDNTLQNRILMTTTGTGSNQIVVVTDNISQASLSQNATFNTYNKCAYSLAFNDINFTVNNSPIVNDSSALLPLVNQMQIGGESGFRATAHIRKISYYPKKLTNTELQALTR